MQLPRRPAASILHQQLPESERERRQQKVFFFTVMYTFAGYVEAGCGHDSCRHGHAR